jgi:hypothetical protein
MAENLREKCARRSKEAIAMAHGGVPKRLQKSPSQKKSEALKRKLNRTVLNPLGEVKEDCRDCTEYPCGKKLVACDKPSMVRTCEGCGEKVRFRVIAMVSWKLCPVCRAKRGE